jgi:DNA-binding MarR family transcriptional regulator
MPPASRTRIQLSAVGSCSCTTSSAPVAGHGVSLAGCEVIFCLAHDDRAQHTPGQLAKAFQITAGSMTGRLDRLERGGYIERRLDPDSRVNIRVTLTAAGRGLHRETVEDIIALRRALITDALPADQLATLNSLLRDVLTHVEDRSV